jgi:hypothetical protein
VPCIAMHNPCCRCAATTAASCCYVCVLLRSLLQFCHAFVGYLEEEAVKTYTQALQVRPTAAGNLQFQTSPVPGISSSQDLKSRASHHAV